MRLKQLDILRAVAVLLVLGRHFNIVEAWHLGGWSGVDLFFVLSGFLISGLLFTEFKEHGRIRFGRFLIRRGFKIYPPFYFFMAWTVAMFLFHHGHIRKAGLLTELFFLQSYGPWMWAHTWSLSVEEHFYLALPLLLLLLVRLSRNREDPFRVLPRVFLMVAGAELVLRLYMTWAGPRSPLQIQFPTHMNVDSLLYGVLLSYFYHFRPVVFHRLANFPSWLLVGGSAVLVAPCFFLKVESNRFIQSFGHPMLYLGYGALLLFALRQTTGPPRESLSRPLGNLLARLGRDSYSVYLWHYAVADWGLEFLRRSGFLPNARLVQFMIYVAGSFVTGIGMARLVEIPSLRLRDRFFPSRSRALLAPSEKDSAQVAGTVSSVADAAA